MGMRKRQTNFEQILTGVNMWYRQIGLGTKLELEIGDEDKEKLILVSQYETYDEKINLMEILVPFHDGSIRPIHPRTIMIALISKG